MVYKILVVDDEEDICNYLKEFLEGEGYSIVSCNRGDDALNILLKQNFSLVLSDIAMPDMDGYELYKNIREIKSDLPIILMTGFGYDPNHAVVRIRKEEGIECIFKPFDATKLLQKVKDRIAKFNKKNDDI
jgi:DNA-binding NtrC family response regulator